MAERFLFEYPQRVMLGEMYPGMAQMCLSPLAAWVKI